MMAQKFRRINKIPCSVGILTLNSGKTLRRCLESVSHFAEIVICDGNSTDNTLEIARDYGCKVIKQYDSDRPNLSCVRDKANVRNKTLRASLHDWHFYLDSDDALSPEAVEEIRGIVADTRLPHLIYRIPLRIIIDGKVVKHSSNYPYFQNRLFHRSAGAYFKGAVHERIVFDKEKYKIGTLRGYYDNHWTRELVKNIFQDLRTYAEWEKDEWSRIGPLKFLSWAVRWPIRSAASIVLSSVRNYLRYGFSESMPPRVEAARLYYQFCLLGFIAKKQLR